MGLCHIVTVTVAKIDWSLRIFQDLPLGVEFGLLYSVSF
jgi:hypothetical protein